MEDDNGSERYIFQTQGVCPPEIHFQIQEGVLKKVRFVGGGCPGNAQLVSRFLQGRSLGEVLELLKEIDCRNGTSCPDQLAKALRSAMEGTLLPARSFKVYADERPKNRIGLIGDLEGRNDILESLIPRLREKEVEVIYCLGNVTGNSSNNREVLSLVRKEGILAIQGELDWLYSQGEESEGYPELPQKERDLLLTLPHVVSFQVGGKKGMAFFGAYLQRLPGYSDFEPFALEMNMVCNLTNFLEDEEVFSALEAMTPQFQARIILFSQIRRWGHWQIGGVDFISVGSPSSDEGSAWGLLEGSGEKIDFKIMKMSSLRS